MRSGRLIRLVAPGLGLAHGLHGPVHDLQPGVRTNGLDRQDTAEGPGARAFRRILTVEAIRPDAGLEVVDRAVEAVREAEARRDQADQAA